MLLLLKKVNLKFNAELTTQLVSFNERIYIRGTKQKKLLQCSVRINTRSITFSYRGVRTGENYVSHQRNQLRLILAKSNITRQDENANEFIPRAS